MTFLHRFVLLPFALVCTLLSPSFAAELVVVDMQQLETMSIAGKALRERIKAERDALKAQVKKAEQELRAQEAKIIEAQKTLSSEEYKKKIQAFEKEFQKKQSALAKKRKSFEKSALEAHGKLRAEVVSVVGEIATADKHKLVLARQSVVIVEKSMDITAQAMQKLNAKIKSIPFQ